MWKSVLAWRCYSIAKIGYKKISDIAIWSCCNKRFRKIDILRKST